MPRIRRKPHIDGCNDYKMRIGVNEGNKQLTILDVCFAAGLRFNMRAPSIYRLFKGTRSRYLLDTREQED